MKNLFVSGYQLFRVKQRLRQFKANAVVGENLRLAPNSLCSNRTGKQDAIIIGNDCFIAARLYVQGFGKMKIGNHVYIGGDTSVGAMDELIIGDCTIISGHTRIMDNNNHPVEPEKRMEMSLSGDYYGPLWSWSSAAHAPVIIEENVWIGEYCAILKGVRIGRGSVVGCHAVVTKDVPPYTVVAGNPAHIVKRLK